MREVQGNWEFAWPNYAYQLTFDIQAAHWSRSTVYGQQTPLVSYAVAQLLLELMPTATFNPHG